MDLRFTQPFLYVFYLKRGTSSLMTARQTSAVTWQNGQDIVVRAQFINNGRLPNTRDTNFRAISNNWPVFAVSHDLGNVGSAATTPVVTSIGHVRDPAIRYIIAGGATQLRSLYFMSQFSNTAAVVGRLIASENLVLRTYRPFIALDLKLLERLLRSP